MKKFIVMTMASMGLVLAAPVYADGGMPQIPAACVPVMEHMMASHKQIQQLIQENKPTDIGNLVIADDQFLQQYPQCKPPMPN